MPDRRAILVVLLAPAGCGRPEQPQAIGSADPATTGPNAAPAPKTTGAEAARSLPRVAMLSFSSPNTSSPNGPPVACSSRSSSRSRST